MTPAGKTSGPTTEWNRALHAIRDELDLVHEGITGETVGSDGEGNLIIFFRDVKAEGSRNYVARLYPASDLPAGDISQVDREEFLRLAFLGDIIPPWSVPFEEYQKRPKTWDPPLPVDFWIGSL